MGNAKHGLRHTIIYRNLDKDTFLKESLTQIKELDSEELNETKYVFMNILETEYNPNNDPIEEYSFRTNDGILLTDCYTLYVLYVPNLLSVLRGENFEDSLIIDSFEVADLDKQDLNNTFSDECTLTNEFLNSTEKKETED